MKWKFKITDPNYELVFYINEDGSITDVNGEITDIFKSSTSVVALHSIVPKLVELMKINTINKLVINEENV